MTFDDYANLFKALSESVRLRIVSLLLRRGELCVCDIVDALELSQSVVSRHLAYLRNNNLVETRREGVWVYYQLFKAETLGTEALETDTFTQQLLELFRVHAEQAPNLQHDLDKLSKLSGRSCS